MDIVKLKNGKEEPFSVVISTMMNLEALWKRGIDGMCAVYDLRELCRNPEYNAIYLDLLQKMSLVSTDGIIHSQVRNIVESAVVGEGLNLTLQLPIAE